MKKLIPTVCMTLLGVSLLSTSTYAWFSANTSATAEGLKIQAVASSSLLISATKGGAYGANAQISANNSMKGICDPVTKGKADGSSGSTTEQNFKKLDDDCKEFVMSNGEIADDKAKYVDTTNDYAKSAVYLMYSGTETDPSVDAKVTINGTDKTGNNIWKAIHVALYTADTATSVADFQVSSLGTATAVKNITGIVSGTEFPLDVYVWVEGKDSECFNNNALSGIEYGIKIEFSLNKGATL